MATADSTADPQPAATGATTIDGVRVLELHPNEDERGSVTEFSRHSWIEPVELPQWNVVRSGPGVMRGMHWHDRHHDLIAAVDGRLLVGLCDLRPGSPTEGTSELLLLDGARPAAALVPPGVAHGLYSRKATIALYAVSRYWDPADELGVAYDDPGLGVPWPFARDEVVVSERDRALPRLASAGRPPSWTPAVEAA